MNHESRNQLNRIDTQHQSQSHTSKPQVYPSIARIISFQALMPPRKFSMLPAPYAHSCVGSVREGGYHVCWTVIPAQYLYVLLIRRGRCSYLFGIDLTGSCGGCHQVGQGVEVSSWLPILFRCLNHSCVSNWKAKIITISGERRIIMHAKQRIELCDRITHGEPHVISRHQPADFNTEYRFAIK